MKPPRPRRRASRRCGAALGRRQPVELARVDEHLALRVLDVRDALVDLAVGRLHDLPDGQVERGREVEVALVVRGHGHDRARAVVGQDVVGDVHGQRSPFTGIDRMQTREDARLLGRLRARSAVFFTPARRTYSRTSSESIRATSSCSGARTKKVAPYSVSGRVVKTGTSSSSSSIRKRISAPSSGRSSCAAAP